MKLLIIFLLPVLLHAQPFKYEQPKLKEKTWYRPFISKNDIVIYSLQAVSGAASGLHDVLDVHPHTFMRMYPNANFDWWIPERSQGRGGLVMIRDGFHFTHAIEHGANYISIGFSFSDFKDIPKKQWWLLGLKRVLISYAVNRLAFNGVYKGWFNDHIERQNAGLDPR